jgi:hypothetical protein
MTIDRTKQKICSKCDKVLPLKEFARNQSTNTGGNKYRRPECRKCQRGANQGKRKAVKLYEEKMGKKIKDLRPDYGYQEEFRKTIDGYPCDCCGKTRYPKKIVFDHCHETNEFRGWICDGCNRSIGVLGDTAENIMKTFMYIAKTSGLTKKQMTNILLEQYNVKK